MDLLYSLQWALPAPLTHALTMPPGTAVVRDALVEEAFDQLVEIEEPFDGVTVFLVSKDLLWIATAATRSEDLTDLFALATLKKTELIAGHHDDSTMFVELMWLAELGGAGRMREWMRGNETSPAYPDVGWTLTAWYDVRCERDRSEAVIEDLLEHHPSSMFTEIAVEMHLEYDACPS